MRLANTNVAQVHRALNVVEAVHFEYPPDVGIAIVPT